MRFLSIVSALFFLLPASAQMPSLQKTGKVTHMMVQGKPFLIIGGELHNSTSSSIGYMEKLDIWGTIEKAHYNTVIASASWELVEPEEGRFNFEQVDYLIKNARDRT
jgi:beta-galactosidase GanA